MGHVFIIAEAGVNHNGDMRLAKKLIDAAAYSGADAVKFQTFRTEKNISRLAPLAEYQQKRGRQESQFDMIKRLELDHGQFSQLARYCRKKKILFLSTPDDADSVDFLDRLGMPIFKIASGEITNYPHLRHIGSLGKKVILSTGMANLKEIASAMEVLIKHGTRRRDISLLHCTSEYPAPLADVNIRAMLTMKEKFGVVVGYSDHTHGIEVSIAAVALGAGIIEKHFTTDKRLPGPDHQASLDPQELLSLVRSIRNVELAMGDGKKQPSACELKNIPVVRRSIFAARDICQGEILTQKDLIAKRPGTGISPMAWDRVIGRRAKRDFHDDEMIEL
ncbi:MAG: N-acetylneuraminate synthase [Candidatus Omnitrophica bacterium]|nr:N-acetylneuraminate synthase [Candidatus Omnitrophota bacterium]